MICKILLFILEYGRAVIASTKLIDLITRCMSAVIGVALAVDATVLTIIK